MAFSELDIISNFTFLTGGSHPEEYVARAAELGLDAIAIADVNSVAGIVRAHSAAREVARQVRLRREADKDPIGPPRPAHVEKPPSAPIYCIPRLIPAARIVLAGGLTVTLLPRDRAAWGRLCRLISAGRLRAEKGDCHLTLDDLLEWGAGSELLLHPQEAQTAQPGARAWSQAAERLTRRFPGQLSLRLAPRYDGQDPARFARLAALAERLGIPPVASAAPVMHVAARRKLTDVLTAIRQGVRVDALGRAALTNAEARMRSEAEMRRLFAGHAPAIDNAAALAARCQFDLSELRYEYPSEIAEGEAPADRLSRLAHAGLRWRYPAGAPDKVRHMLAHELDLIARLNYEPYFLTVHDVVKFARDRGILCQGRGSAANSVTCYALGVTSVSPEIGTMVFERFVSEARDEPPDIDVDFEHERREEVIQHIYARYGRHRAGLCATVIHYRGKRAIREVGKAMGLTDDTISALSSQLWGFFATSGLEDHRLREIGLDPSDRRLAQTMSLIYEIIGFPRHLSQHVDLEDAERVDVVLVPGDDGAVLHRGVLDRDQFVQPALGHDEAADMLREVAREADDLVDQRHGLLQPAVGRVEADLAHALVLKPVGREEAPKLRRERRDGVVGQAHRAADLADRALAAVMHHRGAKPGAVPAVAFVDVLDHLFAALVLEIDVDVGGFVARL